MDTFNITLDSFYTIVHKISDQDIVSLLSLSKKHYTIVSRYLYNKVRFLILYKCNLPKGVERDVFSIPDGFVGWFVLYKVIATGAYLVPFSRMNNNHVTTVDFILTNHKLKIFSHWDSYGYIDHFFDKCRVCTIYPIPMLTTLLRHIKNKFIDNMIGKAYQSFVYSLFHHTNQMKMSHIVSFLSLEIVSNTLHSMKSNLFGYVNGSIKNETDHIIKLGTTLITVLPTLESKIFEDLKIKYHDRPFFQMILFHIPFNHVDIIEHITPESRLPMLKTIVSPLNDRSLAFIETCLNSYDTLSDTEYEIILKVLFQEYSTLVPTPKLKSLLEIALVIHTYSDAELPSTILAFFIKNDIYINMVKLLQSTSNWHPTDDMYEIASNTSDAMLMTLLGEP